MAAVRNFPLASEDAKNLGEQISGAFKKWERDKQELEELTHARNGFLGSLSASSMQHTSSMVKMLEQGSKLNLLPGSTNSRYNQVEDGDERTVLT
jgi:hypothetical protein